MKYSTKPTFGKLTEKNIYYIKKILNKESMELDYLFKNSKGGLEQLDVVQAERQIALENLRKLTNELQTKRLRYKAKSSCKYFTL